MNEMRKLIETLEKINENQQSTPAEFLSDLKDRVWDLEKIAMAYRHTLNKQAVMGVAGADEAEEISQEVEKYCEHLRKRIHDTQ